MPNAPVQAPEIQVALKNIADLAKEPVQPKPVVQEAAPEKITTNSDLLRQIMEGADLSPYITDTMREAYTRSLLGGAPFEHTFTAMGGQVEVTFMEPPADKAAVHGRLASRLSPSDAEGMNALTMLYFLHRVHFSVGTREDLVFNPPDIPSAWETGLPAADLSRAIQDEMIKKMGVLGGSLIRMLASMWIMFSGAWRYLIQTSLPLTF